MDLHATIFTAMGITPKTAFDVEKRPFYATEDGKGEAVAEIVHVAVVGRATRAATLNSQTLVQHVEHLLGDVA